MKHITIRQAKEEDYPAIYEVNTAAFEQDNEARLIALLRNSPAFIPELSLIAIHNDEIVGHILFTKIQIKDENGKVHESLALAPMAVIPQLQKQGIGGQLIQAGLAIAKELGYPSVIVLGHEHYYPRFGFVPADKWNIKSPFDVPSNVFMAIELVNGGLTGVSGMVHYPPAFEAV